MRKSWMVVGSSSSVCIPNILTRAIRCIAEVMKQTEFSTLLSLHRLIQFVMNSYTVRMLSRMVVTDPSGEFMI
jgi:hypothetical protein